MSALQVCQYLIDVCDECCRLFAMSTGDAASYVLARKKALLLRQTGVFLMFNVNDSCHISKFIGNFPFYFSTLPLPYFLWQMIIVHFVFYTFSIFYILFLQAVRSRTKLSTIWKRYLHIALLHYWHTYIYDNYCLLITHTNFCVYCLDMFAPKEKGRLQISVTQHRQRNNEGIRICPQHRQRNSEGIRICSRYYAYATFGSPLQTSFDLPRHVEDAYFLSKLSSSIWPVFNSILVQH